MRKTSEVPAKDFGATLLGMRDTITMQSNGHSMLGIYTQCLARSPHLCKQFTARSAFEVFVRLCGDDLCEELMRQEEGEVDVLERAGAWIQQWHFRQVEVAGIGFVAQQGPHQIPLGVSQTLQPAGASFA